MNKMNRYQQIIEKIFEARYQEGDHKVLFERADIEQAAEELQVRLPKNLGDVVYSFRYRATLPASIRAKAPAGMEWIIRPAGRSRYAFELTQSISLEPNRLIAETKVPDSTPGIIAMYALSDEQALLAKVRYNRLIECSPE